MIIKNDMYFLRRHGYVYQMTSFNDVVDIVVFNRIALSLPSTDCTKLGTVNKKFYQFQQKSDYWVRRLQQDFSVDYSLITASKSPISLYKRLYMETTIPCPGLVRQTAMSFVRALLPIATVLESAATKGYLDIIEYLILYRGMTVEDVRSRNNRALQIAVSRGYIEIVVCLTATYGLNQQDFEPVKSMKYRILKSVVANNHLAVLQYIMNEIKLPLSPEFISGIALTASGYGYLDMLKYILYLDIIDIGALAPDTVCPPKADKLDLQVNQVKQVVDYIWMALEGLPRKNNYAVLDYLFSQIQLRGIQLTWEDIRYRFETACRSDNLIIVLYIVDKFEPTCEEVKSALWYHLRFNSQKTPKVIQFLTYKYKLKWWLLLKFGRKLSYFIKEP